MPSDTRILIVEDDPLDEALILLALRDGLQQFVHKRVAKPEDLREALESTPWDVVLCDYYLPGYDAFKALEIVKAVAPATPLIAVSGAVGEETAVRLMRAGASDYLMKDNLARLVPAIMREVAEAAERRERAFAERRFKVIFDVSPDAAAIFDAVGFECVTVNPGFAAITGQTERELAGVPFIGLPVWQHPEEALEALDHLHREGRVRDLRFTMRGSSAAPFEALLSMDYVEVNGRRCILWIARDASGAIQERARLAREFHDTLAQSLSALSLQLGLAKALLESAPAEARELLDQAEHITSSSIREARRFIWDLQPLALEGRSLEAALRAEFAQVGVPFEFGVQGDPGSAIERRCQEVLLRIGQEALNNIKKHAHADQVRVNLRFTAEAIHLTVYDNGRGFVRPVHPEQSSDGGGFGLRGMSQRAEIVGGETRIESMLDIGTKVSVRIPYTPTPSLRARTGRAAQAPRRSATVRVLIADDFPLAREGLRQMLSRQRDIEIVGEAANGIDAVRLARELSPSLLVMDVHMPGMDGVSAVAKLAELGSGTRTILISADARDEQILAGLRAGARGFLLKDSGATLLAEAVQAVQAGRTFVSPEIANRLAAAFPIHLSSALTGREREILEMLASGLRNKEIALRLQLGAGTVKWHVGNVLQKLQVTTRTEAVHVARKRGLLD